MHFEFPFNLISKPTMLKELRRSEESFEDGSKIAYLLQVGKHADSVIYKMFRDKGDRGN